MGPPKGKLATVQLPQAIDLSGSKGQRGGRLISAALFLCRHFLPLH